MKGDNLLNWVAGGLLALLLAQPCAAEDVTNAKDHPLFPRMPGFEITRFESNFDSVAFPGGQRGGVTLEGRKTSLDYWLAQGSAHPNGPQIIRNYGNAAIRLGGQVVHEQVTGQGVRQGVYRLVKNGREIWLWVLPADNGQGYRLTVLEVGESPQEFTSRELLGALDKDGRVALYLNFAANRHDLKPEARPIIAKVAAMLQENPELHLTVDGHTDNQGDPMRNKTLSELRAQAVVKALVRAGVDPARLRARGFGQEVPLAGNDDEEGRAQNQRIELIRQ